MTKGETKEQRFKRLATQRVRVAIKRIELVGNLSSGNYAYTADDADKICGALEGAVNGVKEKFMGRKKKNEDFNL